MPEYHMARMYHPFELISSQEPVLTRQTAVRGLCSRLVPCVVILQRWQGSWDRLAYHDTDEAQLVELVVAPLSCKIILLFWIGAIQENHYGSICGVGWRYETAAEDLEDGS